MQATKAQVDEVHIKLNQILQPFKLQEKLGLLWNSLLPFLGLLIRVS